ncbi:GMP/IMP nucleotidase [Dasania marina]|uniref:GMP/IMP nucleotidase n=1 Tax=Dasania marina TaxID=471499 RepID=UPI0003824B5A|nr:GMP/IMP nucleotidase [Dasania marina]
MINWHTIDTVLLDMDGTLLDLHYDNHFWLEYLPRRYADKHQRPIDEVKAELFSQIMSQKGHLNWYCLDYWSQRLEMDIIELKREIKHMIVIRPHVEEFLRQLRHSHHQVILVTNAHRDGLVLKLEQTGLEPWFDEIVASHDYQAPKEQQQFWQQLQQQHPFDPAKTLFIDDSISVLESAQQYGIKHLLTLLQPDSKKAAQTKSDFPSILHFDEIMPLTSKNKNNTPSSQHE